MGRLRELVSGFGPGLVFLLASVGAEDLVTNSAAGMSYGYGLLWTLPLILIARFIILEASARYVVVTGESLLAGYCRVSRWVGLLLMIAILLRLHLHHISALLLIGESASLVAPLPVAGSAVVWGLAFWGAGFALAYWGGYNVIERWFRPLLVLLGGCLLLAAVASRPDPVALVRGVLVPSVPAEDGVFRYSLVLMALAGAGASSLGNLKYAAFVHEKGWRDRTFLTAQRRDLWFGIGGLLAMSILIQVAAAAALGPASGRLETASDLVPMFTSIFGDAGRVVLGLGLWSAVFTTYVGTTSGYSLLVSDMWRSLSSRQATVEGSAGAHPAYRWAVIWFCVSPLYVLLTDWQPVWLVLAATALLVVLTPLVVIVLLVLTSDRVRMGERANGWTTKAAMVLITAVAVYLTAQNAAALWAQLSGGYLAG